jgi:hypothetical protein
LEEELGKLLTDEGILEPEQPEDDGDGEPEDDWMHLVKQ